MLIPDRLAALAREESGAPWLNNLPTLIEALCQKWALELESPYAEANVSFVAPVRQGEARLVLKVQWPHPECLHEAEALRCYAGRGAVRLLVRDEARHAFLLERCEPGDSLADRPKEEALEVLQALLPRLLISSGGPFDRLQDESVRWADGLHETWERTGRPCERALVDAAVDALRALGPTQAEAVLVHQDLHGGNVIQAQREPWLAIDPKPILGERAFSIAPIVRSPELGHSPEEVVDRLFRLCDALGVDPCAGGAGPSGRRWRGPSTGAG